MDLLRTVVCVHIVLVQQLYFCSAKQSVTIGYLSNEHSAQIEFTLNSTLLSKNRMNDLQIGCNIQQIMENDIFGNSNKLCNMLESTEGIAAIFGPQTSLTSPIIESICTNLEIPYIMTSWKQTSSKPTNFILNLYPEADRFARGLAAVVKSLEYNGFIIIYETEEGLIRLQEVLKLQNLERKNKQDFVRVKQLESGPDYRTVFKKFRNTTENNIILDCKTENIIPILQQAKSLNMLNLPFNYFLTSLDAHTLDYSVLNATANITAIRLFDYNSENFTNSIRKWELSQFESYNGILQVKANTIKTETALFHDALLLLTDTLNELDELPINQVKCDGNEKFSGGFKIMNFTKNRDPSQTLTGPIRFDEDGNRIDFDIYVYNVIGGELIATWYASNETLIPARTSDETDIASVSNLKKIKVIVSTRFGEPYLMAVESEPGRELIGNARYKGYAKDLMDEVAKLVDFSYELHITEDGEYGKYSEQKKKWTGLVGDLLEKRAHLAVCDLTITHQRREVVDFSMPFMTLGISILHKYPEKKEINMFAFLDPFATTLWIYTATLYMTISIILFFIARMTPGDWENPHPCDQDPRELENIWGFQNCYWATLGAIMNQGSDILPKGISTRVALAMWWLFALIITNSYTANLTAFLTKDKMEPAIDSAEALAKQNKIKYGLLDGGSTQTFFRETNVSTFQRMYMNMKQQKPSVFEKENKDGVARVQSTKNGLYAFLMESTQIEYEIETKCELKQVGNWLDTKSYGIAMPMNAPYRGAINKAVLQLQETGVLTTLKERWWKNQGNKTSCDKSRNVGQSDNGNLDLATCGGIFLVLCVGLSIAVTLGVLEFLWNVRNISIEEHMTYWEALTVEVKFACNIWNTKKRIKPILSESSSGSEKSDKTDNKSRVHNILHSASSFLNLNTST